MTPASRHLNILHPVALAIFAMSLSTLAFAHTGAGETPGFIHGLTHTLGGLDHVCAMFAVGLWAAQMGGRAVWLAPLAFIGVMALGGLLGMTTVPVPFVDMGIAISSLVVGMLIAAAVRLPLPVSITIVGVFAVLHGYAHGAEMPQDASGLAYASGFVLATALLHACGITVALFAKNHGRTIWLRLAGTAIALCGCGIWLAG